MTYFHAAGCCATKDHSDAAKKVSDTYNLHRIAGDTLGIQANRKWFACALQDGESDGVLYDSKSDAIRHQHHNEQWYTFICIGPHSMTPCEAEVMLSVARRAYDKGMRLADPDDRTGGRELIKRTTIEDMRALAGGRATSLIMPGDPRYHLN